MDDSPTSRYGRHVEGAGVHHNPTPGPADGEWLYGHDWVALAWLANAWNVDCLGLNRLETFQQSGFPLAKIVEEDGRKKWRVESVKNQPSLTCNFEGESARVVSQTQVSHEIMKPTGNHAILVFMGLSQRAFVGHVTTWHRDENRRRFRYFGDRQ